LVLDGKNDLYDETVDYLADIDSEEQPLSKKTVLIDPNEAEYSVGLNYLQLMGDTTPDALAGLVVEAFKKFCGKGNEYEAWLEEWLPPSLIPLIKAKLTLLELFHFLNLQDPLFRDAVISRLDTGFYKTKWETLKSFRPHEQAFKERIFNLFVVSIEFRIFFAKCESMLVMFISKHISPRNYEEYHTNTYARNHSE